METIPRRVTTLTLIAAAAAVALAAPAHADDASVFLSPSGNIICEVRSTGPDGKSGATCEIRDHTYVPPQPKPLNCHLGWGDRIGLQEGSPPVLHCHGDTEFGLAAGQPTLAYGQGRSAGTITCDSEPTGMTCADSSTGHYFRISRESLEFG